jgi:molybdopterin/thiamine biosynthesis adenylyltransferase
VDVGKAKVQAVAQRLRQISPAVRVTEAREALGGAQSEVVERLDECDVIIDCTASDEVLMLLAMAWWPIPRIFASFSMGYGAKRLFLFGVNSHRFPHDEFTRSIRPWMEHETKTWAVSDEVLEGAGCWSPLFPARNDDVAIAAAICVKELETLVAKRSPSSRFRVFSQSTSDEGFQGFAPENSPSKVESVVIR